MQAMIALGQVPGWWECGAEAKESYPMDYYAKDGGSWNSVWAQKSARAREAPSQQSRLVCFKAGVQYCSTSYVTSTGLQLGVY